MAVVLVFRGERNTVRPGDAVFDYVPGADYPLHVGVFVGKKQKFPNKSRRLTVSGVPGHRGKGRLGVADWGGAGDYKIDLIGQRLDVSEANVKQVALLSHAVLTEHTQLGSRCSWSDKGAKIDRNHRIRDGIPLFERGTCADFVEYLYEQSGLDLIRQEVTFNPARPRRIYPACQIHVFWSARYGLPFQWDARYESFPECLIGRRSRKR